MSYIDEIGKYRRVAPPDKESLSELVIRAKGARRSMRQFAKECHKDPSTLSRIVNKKTLGANSDTLIATIADHADPDSGVTFEMLMQAHGMALTSDNSATVIRRHIEASNRIIQTELLKRSYSIRDGQEPWLNSFLGRCIITTDMRTDALGKKDSVWLMEVWNLRPSEESDIERASDRLRQWLLMYVGMLNVDSRHVDRFSIILSSKELFQTIIPKLGQYKYKNDLSIILVDFEEEKVMEEFLVKMDHRLSNDNVFYAVKDTDEEKSLREDIFDRPEIL